MIQAGPTVTLKGKSLVLSEHLFSCVPRASHFAQIRGSPLWQSFTWSFSKQINNKTNRGAKAKAPLHLTRYFKT